MIIQVIFYSMYGHTFPMAEAEAEGAREVPDADVRIYQVDELVPEEILEHTGAKEAHQAFSHIPYIHVDQMAEADGFLFGTPTRYGMMCAQMRNFLDKAGGLWSKGMLENKVAGVFTSSMTQHGGQESTILSFHATLLHLGMIVVGVPYSEQRQSIMTEITGGSPYGASTVVGHNKPDVRPTANELAIAKAQGRHVAEITAQMLRGKHARKPSALADLPA